MTFDGLLRPERTTKGARKAWLRIVTLTIVLSVSFRGFAQDAGSETTVSFPVIEKSPGESPVVVSGTLWLARRLREDTVQTSEAEEITWRDISSKPIVTLVARMTGCNCGKAHTF